MRIVQRCGFLYPNFTACLSQALPGPPVILSPSVLKLGPGTSSQEASNLWFLKSVCKNCAWVHKHSHHMFCRGEVTCGSHKVRTTTVVKSRAFQATQEKILANQIPSRRWIYLLQLMLRHLIAGYCLRATLTDKWLRASSGISYRKPFWQPGVPNWLTIRCSTVSMSCLHFSQK